MIAILEIDESARGKTPGAKLIAGIDGESGKAAGIFVGIRVEERTIENAEDGSGGTNTEGESENGNGGEAAVFAQIAQRMTKILKEGFEEWEGLLVADKLLGLREATEFEESVATGFGGSHAGAKVVVDVELEMGVEFSTEVAIATTKNQVQKAVEYGAKRMHE